MIKVNASTARDQFPELITRAGYGGERILVERHGKAIAAIITPRQSKTPGLQETEGLLQRLSSRSGRV